MTIINLQALRIDWLVPKNKVDQTGRPLGKVPYGEAIHPKNKDAVVLRVE